MAPEDEVEGTSKLLECAQRGGRERGRDGGLACPAARRMPIKRPAVHHAPTHRIALSTEELRGGVHHYRGAVLDGAAEVRSGKCVVHNERHVDSASRVCQRPNVRDDAARICETLGPQGLQELELLALVLWGYLREALGPQGLQC